MNKAYKYLQRAVDLSPDDPMIILQLAIIELEGQRFEEAYDLLRRAYQIDPDNPEIIFLHGGSIRLCRNHAGCKTLC
ncbi:tetratricopeptide repeat protein [Lysinibacillus sp. MHQ-1]|nr:tetratricopeptide repeat protein [Lysinibacillus sp. MHQ-1]